MTDVDRESQELAARLEQHFAELFERCMKDMPICNFSLQVACVGFQPFGDFTLGIVLTPWFMNICAAPRAGAPKVEDQPGATRTLALPAGNVDFLATDLDGERLLFASLFSPMQDFVDHAAALATAEAAMAALMKTPDPAPPPPPEKPKEKVALDRRAFFRLGKRA
ncbi:hypothetical protein CCR94_14105 [Rhodoblastus sphagnicola]|uniref:Hydrogenase formation protein HupJ n=1 Tax=Rhodoblastus sphagnicola TaxID=333368 RepID=A0A2S6N579_9HYPH|nr:[NiFe]-hydrogenase assembly chaperone HybE [Rhodoblastus sphagnicola]MBB4197165.1 [NiFe] hydrogenase assembly HybE family chaperone [Rhodoblastus sphagnicola]PPQ29780.1 hypothetical protein CCR94_14105 [Rhodoblastus sphagnicola]